MARYQLLLLLLLLLFCELDFTNAFNSLRRDHMLNTIALQLPELFNFCISAYDQESFLKFGSSTVLSQEGVQQGDPLGPLLFCLTLQPLLDLLSSELRIGYLDDISLGGDRQVLLHDLRFVISEGKRIDLLLNFSKCEIINSACVEDLVEFVDFERVDSESL